MLDNALFQKTKGCFVALLLSLLLAPLVQAQSLQVAVRENPPFVMQDAQGNYHGLSIQLWEQIAQQQGWQYSYHKTSLADVLAGVAEQRFDVGVGAIYVTAEREQLLDFTQPFFNAGLGIAVKSEQQPTWWLVITRFFSWDFVSALTALIGILLLSGWLVWLFERRHNEDEFQRNSWRGIGAGFWWAAVTMTTVGYGDKSPRTTGGRAVALVWMFTSVIIISSFTASIASSLTVNQLGSAVKGPADLANFRVATLPDSYSAEWLNDRSIGYRGDYQDLQQALQALQRNEVDAVVYDAPLLKYLVRQYSDASLRVLPNVFMQQDYAFAVAEDSPLREQINRSLLDITATNEWQQAVSNYLGSNQ
ncbi:transporter substrate-binding domain-containing protein [Idiomarina xiamenensis]|uniref:Family 3 extracellular solute-binding protein n=1 Tax=Idiomarina xiamenensis 10-D-4 TaxID=740709 RepID=K2KSP7_9GAMM|nr:transporter substrate-binding domain-containing protein [Idiomarina xiamenensis]EKE80625.1 family 3 extracellular solute-binding protein [Idiomarina xiamenensis 10-D-4]